MPEDKDIFDEITEIIKEELPKALSAITVTMPDIQKVEVQNPSEVPKMDFSGLEKAFKEFATKKKDTQDFSKIERLLRDIQDSLVSAEQVEQIDTTKVLAEILETLQNNKPQEIDLDFVVDEFRAIVEEVKEIKKSANNGYKGGAVGPSKKFVMNVNGQAVNPSTEDKQDTIIANQTNNTQKVQITAQDSPSIDAFARWRVSNPETIFDSKQLWDNAPLFWDDSEVSGGTTSSTHSTATASTVIGVALNTAGRRVRQTFMRFNYQPGKSQLILMTGTLDASGGGTGITQSWGYYDDDNGIFLKNNEGTIQFVIRSKATGSVVNNAIDQVDWNLDKMDGTGGSGITLDCTKSLITIVDLEWLGVGRVRVGFVINGIPIYVHEFNHANILAGVYMSTPNLPLRYEIENDGTGVASTLEHICSSVMSEGGVQSLGILRHFDSGAISGLSAGTTYAILGIKLKSTHLDASVIIENISALATTQNDQAHWDLILNPTVAGTFTYGDATNSALQTATGAVANTITNGIEIDGGYFSTVAPTSITTPNALRLGADIANTVDTIVLTVTPITNNIAVHASVTLRELS